VTYRTALVVAASALTAATLGLSAQAPGDKPATITFSENVAPIIFNNCTSCHRPGEAAPFSLMSYEDVRPRGRSIVAVIASRQMPPWKAAPGDYPYHGDRRLTDEQIATVQQWAAQGMLEGDRSKLPKMPAFTDGWPLGPPDLIVSMREAFDVPATGGDIYRNFAIPLNLTEDKWVRAIDFRPSARSVVHHSLFFFDTTGEARQLDEQDRAPGYAGGMGGVGGRGRLRALLGAGGRGRAGNDVITNRVGGGLGGWVPGRQPTPLPEGLALFLPKGSDLVLSTHFHPSGKPQRETSTVGLYFTDKVPTQAFTGIQLPPLFGALTGIDIPAGDAHYTISDSFVVPVDVSAFGVGGHAHYIGKELKMTATLPDGAVKNLLSIPDWDFSWQEQYRFERNVTLPAGTKLDVSIRYDNSAANRRNPSSPPKEVAWGEQSTDEMGSMTLQVVAVRPNELPKLQQAYAQHVRDVFMNGPLMRAL